MLKGMVARERLVGLSARGKPEFAAAITP